MLAWELTAVPAPIRQQLIDDFKHHVVDMLTWVSAVVRVRIKWRAGKVGEIGAPGGIRTPDPRSRNPLLYPLSYGRDGRSLRNIQASIHGKFKNIR
jgi:hypothetical protein